MPYIRRIDIYRARVPLISPFRTAYGSDAAVEPVLVRMSDGDHYGWGESQAFHFPTFCPEYSAGVFQLIRDVLAPAIVGQELTAAEVIHERLKWFKGNPFAKGALDMAYWDLVARSRGEPLYRLFGGCDTIEVGADFGVMDSHAALIDKIAEALAAGYTRVKLKFAPGWDTDMLAAVRKAFPDTVFHIDCNSAYTLADVELFKRIDDFGLAMIEQPLAHDDLVDHAALQERIRTPICLDESITSPDKARKAIAIGACRWINIKPIRVGGLTPARAIHDLCAKANVPCWVGGMVETGLGMAHCAVIASLANIRYPNDIFPSKRFFAPDLAGPGLTLSGPARMRMLDTPGVGVEPDPARLEQWTLDRAQVTETQAMATGATLGGR